MNGSWVILLDDRVCTIQAEFKGDDLKIFIDGRALEFISTFYRWNRYQFSIALPRLRITDLS